MLREHIGEATAPVNGTCEHPMMIKSKDGTQCVLVGRVDIAGHFIKTGGYVGLKERYEAAVSRLQSFGRYMFDPAEYPVAGALFSSPDFVGNARTVCPDDKQVLDPFQFNLIVQVPGQTVALHVDGVYFWGASRFQFPQWLLAAMQFSGLFQEEFIDQVQVVGYYHNWTDTDVRGGDFVYWTDNGDAHHISPVGLAGSVVDGSKTVHAGTVYHPGRTPPLMDKSKRNTLEYLGGERWALKSDGDTLQEYDTDDLRCTVVYRARCFASEEERERYAKQQETGEGIMSLDDVLARMLPDMVARGWIPSVEAGKAMPRVRLAELLLGYVKYPLPPKENAVVPYNYCALPRLYPWTWNVLKYVC